MKSLKIFIGIVACAVALLSFNNFPQLDAILEKLATYNSKYPEEKLYIHVDKPFYRPGESIWFSLYALNGITHQPSAISSVAYVQLIDPKGNVIAQPELYLKEGVSYGDFKLHGAAPGGLYRLKAYSAWTLNFKNQKVFEKEIQVQNISTPRMLLKLEWEREAYGPGDSAVAIITARNLKDEMIQRAEIKYKVFNEGQETTPAGRMYTNAGGTARVKFAIPASIKSPDGLLQAVVSAGGLEESISRSIPIALNEISLRFFPEGGDLVAGQETKVAFKALNEFGKAADVEGDILADNNVIGTFSSYHMGMGTFPMKPDGRKYTARIRKPAINKSYDLPVVATQGHTLNLIEHTNDLLRFKVNSTSGGQVYLVCTIHGQAVWQKAVDLVGGTATIDVNTNDKKFIPGIGVFTLFDQSGRERCERLVFIKKEQQLNIELRPNKQHYRPGEKVDLDIVTTDPEGSPVPARLSLAVVDDQLVTFADDKQDNILSWFQLSSEVRGDVQEPSFYFEDKEKNTEKNRKKNTDQALDYLLMAQGWRRFKWADISNNIPITYMPDKEGTISGYTQTKETGHRGTTDITLIEMGNDRRAKKIETRPDGSFDFVNADPTVPSLLITKRPYLIFLTHDPDAEKLNGFVPSQKKRSSERKEDFDAQAQAIEEGPVVEPGNTVNSDFSMANDVSSLQEIVVVGYGAEFATQAAGCISVIRQVTTVPLQPIGGLEPMLIGRVPGIQISGQSGVASRQMNVQIRGISSLASGNNEPLYVIDGVPIASSLNANFSPSAIVSPDNIESIQIFNTPETPTLFGSRASNGVIGVVTKNTGNDTRGYSVGQSKSRYNYIIVPQRQFTVGREFYVPPVVKVRNDEQRNDFRTTVFWSQHIVTDRHGKASISFLNNDNTSVFRITTEGITANGHIGRNESTYSTQLPFSVDVKLPEFIGFEDTVMLPVRITNATSRHVAATLTIDAPAELNILPSKLIEVDAFASTVTTTYITVVSNSKAGTFPVTIKTHSDDFSDEIKHNISVHPVGFPVRRTWSSSEQEKTIEVLIDDAEKGSLHGQFEAYPDLLGTLVSDAKAMLHEPYGCFEQVSSTTFPNIMALQYIRKLNKVDKVTEEKALKFIRSGYDKLMAYEIKHGGFEWFGKPPAHEALSAFGMLEFFEMQKVYPGVDPDVVSRTAGWLLDRRDGKGGFSQNRGKYGFSAAPAKVNNAYIVYALAATGHTGFENEYNEVVKEVWESKDLYRMALAAIASYHLRKTDQYHALVDYFKGYIEESGFDNINAHASIVYSSSLTLRKETIAFWVIAMAKEPDSNLTDIIRGVKYLMEQRGNFGFGSTQTTTVCLQALCTYYDIISAQPGTGTISISVNNIESDLLSYQEHDTVDVLVAENFVKKLTTSGKQPVSVKFSGGSGMPWQLKLDWYSKQPDDCESCKLDLSTTMTPSAKVNETVRLTAVLTNKSTQGLPMSMAVIGIPAGLSVQPWQLKELQEKEVFDFYEITGDRLAIYYRELGPSAIVTINLDLKAELPGTYQGAASTAYLYYSNECKQWAEGLAVSVRP